MLIATSTNIHTQRIVKWLQKAGCEIFLIDETKPMNLNYSQTHFYYYPHWLSRSKRWGWSRFYRWVGYFQLHYLWRKIKPDIVHLLWIDWKAFHCYRSHLKPLVITCLGDDINQHFYTGKNPEYYYDGRNSQYGAIKGRALVWAEHVFADSRQVIERCNILAKRSLSSSLLYIGIDTTHFQPGYNKEAQQWQQLLEIPKDARILLSIRALQKNYRHDLILEAFACARKSLHFPVFLIFKRFNISDTALEQHLIKLAEMHGVERYIRWIDKVPYDRMPEIYAMADILVNFPVEDGFPVSFFEAAACSKPVISNNLLVYEEQPIKTFFHIVQDGSVQGLAQGLIEVLNEAPETTDINGKRARKWAEKVGDERVSIDALLDVYNRIRG